MTNANNPALKSWIEVPVNSDFPIQNLPFGVIRKGGKTSAAVAIGQHVVDLSVLHSAGFFKALSLPFGIFNQTSLNDFIALGRKTCGNVRERVSELLRHDNNELKSNAEVCKQAIILIKNIEMVMPVKIPNYTDFYSSEEHARNVGSMFRDPGNALLPNWKHLPVGYHGRASSIVLSGTPIRRPSGQIKLPDSENPIYSPTRKLDFELELAFITCTNTQLGEPVALEKTEDHIFGFVLFNDWSARDIQNWEYAPLGPFLGKNFGSTISPWIVTLDALEPFRVEGPEQKPEVLSYLKYSGKRNFDINLEVTLKPSDSDETVICQSNFKYMYWNIDQQLAHQTVNGCNIQVGDLYASGTISGPMPGSYGSLLELTWNGKNQIKLNEGRTRTFIENGDTIVMRGFAQKDNVRIGFGECSGMIV